MFKPADHNRRMPVYLQPNTKENLVWQLSMLAPLMVGIVVWEKYKQRQFDKRMAPYMKNPTK